LFDCIIVIIEKVKNSSEIFSITRD
jgi:hypothetical protein